MEGRPLAYDSIRRFAAMAALVLLAGCVRLIPGGTPPAPPPTPPAANALLTGVKPGPRLSSLKLGKSDAGAALASFVESCPKLLVRTDQSGLTRTDDWRPACKAATSWRYDDAPSFFETYFETARVGDGNAFATGYYEPEIEGSRTRIPGYDAPVYKMPADLVRGWPDDIPEKERTGQPPLGRYDGKGKFVPYYERSEIDKGVLAGQGLEIAWAKDPIELFFLQIQGSGRLRAPDGSVMRIGYAGQNGREYVGVGSVMRDRGLIGSGPGQYSGSMQGIMQYLREQPDQGREVMELNKSWVFFREVPGDGPIGALGVPVRGESSVAADPAFVPLGAPVWLDLDRTTANGLWIAQDTGGAIKGANRFDTFWGAGTDARQVAGGMSGRGQALLFLPRGTLSRLGVE
jgi:membrane-bound lytic murein transglycosylase A